MENYNNNNKGETNAISHHPLTHARLALVGYSAQLLFWAGHSVVWNIPLATLGHLSHLCLLQVSSSSLADHETGKKPLI